MPRRLGSRFRRTCVRGFPGLRLLDHPDRFLRNDVGGSQMLGCGWRFGRLGIKLDVRGRLATKNIRYRLAGGLRSARLFLYQRLPVSDRDLIIIRMNFGKGQEAVTVPAVINEGGLER